MKVSFGAIAELPSDWDLEKGKLRLQALEDYGFARIGCGDAPALAPECYVALTFMALNTRRVEIGTSVTNPVLREPSVMAAALATIDALSGGRVVLAIATGAGAVFTVGMRPATVEELKEYVLAVQGLIQRGEAFFKGRMNHILWSDRFRRRHIPIYIVAGGPKTLRLAGQIADGVLIGTGLLPEVIADAKEHIYQGAKEAGRKLEDIDLWWGVRANIGYDRRKALQDLLPSLAGIANHLSRFTLEGKGIPKELKGAFREFQRRYDWSKHYVAGSSYPNAALLEGLGLTEYVAERFALVGTAEDIITKVNRLAGHGVTKIWLDGRIIRPETAQMFGQHVIPHFQA